MSYVANNYNYATPLSSVVDLVGAQVAIADEKYFSLSDNVLDGSYVPITGDVGLWSSTASDANGVLSPPFIVTVTEELTMNAFRLVGSIYCYPVAFTVKLYNDTTLLHTITETANSNHEYVYYFTQTFVVTSYEVSITKVSKLGAAARLYNLYNPGYVKRIDTLKVHNVSSTLHGQVLSASDSFTVMVSEESAPIAPTVYAIDALLIKESNVDTLDVTSNVSDALYVKESSTDIIHNTIDVMRDTLRIKHVDNSAILNTIDVTTDRLTSKLLEHTSHVLNTIDVTHNTLHIISADNATLTNVHSRMKDPYRRIYGKVYITYTDPMIDADLTITTTSSAYNSEYLQVLNGGIQVEHRYFTLYDNNLSGSYVLSGPDSEVGWTSGVLSDANGIFATPQTITVNLSSRPITGLSVYFDDSHDSVAKDFVVTFTKEDGSIVSYTFTNNTKTNVRVTDESIANVVSVAITIHSVTKPYTPVTVLEIPVSSTLLYRGYEDVSDLMSIDLLEELTYEDDVEALGGVSANEVTVTLDNSTRAFFFNNTQSLVAKQLKRNRKIVPWLGVEVIPGEIEWYTLGTFWSYKWDVPVDGLTASVVGFDTIGLLDLTDFKNHHVQINKSIGQLIEYVLTDANDQLGFLDWKIDEALYDVTIPYAWFDVSSHTAALRKISGCYPMHIYCDRAGRICAAPQKLRMDFYYDTWSNGTNVISKDYSSLYTTLPNVIDVEVKNPIIVQDVVLVDDSASFNVEDISSRILNFNEPYVSDISAVVTCDTTVEYSYDVFAWGIVFNFTGTGIVTGIKCTGTSLDTSHTSTIVGRNEQSIRANGAVKRSISSDFIQRIEHANALINRILSLSEYDKFDVEVQYRGDIALTINDPILLLDGIALDNRYNIRRHQLFWNGSLGGSAHLNT